MDAFETISTVLAVRAFQSKPIAADQIRRILEAGRLTGSGSNQQPWHFIVVDEPAELSKLAELAQSGPYIAQAPVAIVVAVDRTALAVSDGSRAIQSMVITAWSEGIGSNWVGYIGMTGINQFLNIPDNLDVLAILPFGYPVKQLGQGKRTERGFLKLPRMGNLETPCVSAPNSLQKLHKVLH